jgi:hypothetical protein
MYYAPFFNLVDGRDFGGIGCLLSQRFQDVFVKVDFEPFSDFVLVAMVLSVFCLEAPRFRGGLPVSIREEGGNLIGGEIDSEQCRSFSYFVFICPRTSRPLLNISDLVSTRGDIAVRDTSA